MINLGIPKDMTLRSLITDIELLKAIQVIEWHDKNYLAGSEKDIHVRKMALTENIEVNINKIKKRLESPENCPPIPKCLTSEKILKRGIVDLDYNWQNEFWADIINEARQYDGSPVSLEEITNRLQEKFSVQSK